MKTPTFEQFCTTAVRIALSDEQRVWIRVHYDNVEPQHLEGADREIARTLFGPVDVVPKTARTVVVGSFGRGTGKTTIAIARLNYRGLFADVSMLGAGDIALCPFIAARLAIARDALSIGRGQMETAQIGQLIDEDKNDSYVIVRPDGRRVRVAAFAAAKASINVRGRPIVEASIDESEFIGAEIEGDVVNDAAQYSALVPRLLPGGKVSMLSTPWPAASMTADLIEKQWGAPVTALVAKGATTFMRHDPHIIELAERERLRDPITAAMELDVIRGVGSMGAFDMTAMRRAMRPVGAYADPLAGPQ